MTFFGIDFKGLKAKTNLLQIFYFWFRMGKMKMRSKQKKSITREPHLSISLGEFYEKVENKEFEYYIKLLREEKGRKSEVFEILSVLGKGRTTFTFLSLYNKKFTALRMSYDDEDFTGKFDSVMELMGEDYKKSFLDVLYPSMPVQRLYYGSLKEKKEIWFDKTVYVSFWEKADALLENKRDESFEKKFKWFREFLNGLGIIHAKNRAHFDIKPENLFLVDNRLKIGDFEFYWKVKDFIKAKEYLYCGSIGYIAPEMFYDRENITSKVDIFSAGVAFARLFTGEPYRHIKLNSEDSRQLKEILQKCESPGCFNGAHMAEIKESLCYSFFYRRLVMDKIEKEGLTVPERFLYEEILLEMMSPDPVHRPAVEEIMDKLENRALPGIEIAKTIEEIEIDAPRIPKGLWLLVGFLVVLTVGVFLYFFVFNRGGSVEPSRSPAADAAKTNVIKPPVGRKRPAPQRKETGKKITKKPAQKKVEPVSTVEPPGIKPGIPPEEKEKIKEQAKYDTYLDIAGNLVKDGEYERALDMIARAKEIKEDDELRELEGGIKKLIEEKQVQEDYERFYREAQRSYREGDYKGALRNIEIARRVKNTLQLTTLELQAKRKIREREEEYEKGLALVADNIVNENYTNAKELIAALKKIKTDDRLLELEKEVNRKLSMAARQRQEEENEFMKHLQKVQAYMDNGDFEKAGEEIKKAGKIKNSGLLKQLEKKLKGLQEKTQREYDKYYKWAGVYLDHGQLEQAGHYLELAKNIYRSHEVVVLEKEIEEKIRERDREQAAGKADDEAYFSAIRGGGVWDLDEYIREYPHGRHTGEVKLRLDQMLERMIPGVDEPRLLKRVEPVYRRRAGRKRISDIVKVEVVIDKYGNVKEVEVIEGHWTLRYAAEKAVKQWKYEPVIIGGEPRGVWFRVELVFGEQEGDYH
jgi:TonB family protein